MIENPEQPIKGLRLRYHFKLLFYFENIALLVLCQGFYHCSINTSKRDFLKKIKKSSYKSFLSKMCSFTENLSR